MNKREFLRLSGILGAGIAISPMIACNQPESDKAEAKDTSEENNLPPVEFLWPALGYAFNALKPSIDAMTMEIHHGKHHAAYVKNLNLALAENKAFGGMQIEEILAAVSDQETAIRNNGGGHYNHSLYWQIIAPGGGNAPEGALLDAITSTFGSVEKFAEDFSKAATTRFGSGWAWLSVDANKKLFISSTPNQDNPLMTKLAEQKGQPILGIDVWEHAYYLNYQNKRADYVSAFMSILNWNNVSANYAKVIA